MAAGMDSLLGIGLVICGSPKLQAHMSMTHLQIALALARPLCGSVLTRWLRLQRLEAMQDGRANVDADFGSWFPSPRLKTAGSVQKLSTFYRESLDLRALRCVNCRLAGILEAGFVWPRVLLQLGS